VKRVIVDTGPLVALLNAREAHHAWVRETLDDIEPPLWTCEAVITEACFLMRQLKGGSDAVLALVSRGVVKIDFRLSAELEPVSKLMTKYASVPMSLADACLVRMTEVNAQSVVLTLDDDFRIYRRNGRHVVPVIMAKTD
jgi:predicted nucleic acid-binding protein